jgi:hypothetical protein
MATATQPTVVFSPEQRHALCCLLGGALQNGSGLEGDDEVRFWIVAARLLETFDWRDLDAAREAYEVTVDEEVLWLAQNVFEPDVRENCVPELEQTLADEDQDRYSNFLEDTDEARAWWREGRRHQIRKYRARISATRMILEAVAVMSVAIESRCEHCGDHDVRLDERGWCEQCWLGLRPAYQLFQDLEEVVKQALDAGVLTSAQLQDALRMSFENVDGPLAGTGFRREPSEAPNERGIWHLPPSAFDSDPRGRRNQIALLRHGARMSLEAVAEKIGVPPEEVALWEQDVLPAEEHAAAAAAMCALFCASPAFVFGLEGEVA